MPAFNARQYIGEAIESLIGQTMPHWELIVVDDLSADNTLGIARDYASKDPRIKAHQLSENSGGGFAPRNAAISLAQSEWIVYLDSDDKIESDYLLKLRRRIEDVPDAKLILTRMVISDHRCNPTLRTYPDANFDMSIVSDGKSLVKDTFIKWGISFGGIAADKATTLRVIELMKSGPHSSYLDEIMSRYQLIYTRKVAFADAKYYYRSNPASVTKRPSVKTFDFLINNMRLTKLTKEYFGKESEEYKLAQTELYLRIFEKLRVLARNEFSKSESQTANSLIKQSMDTIDWDVMKRQLSTPRYLFTRYSPLSLFYWIFKLNLYK